MSIKILLVDKSEQWLKSAKKYLVAHHYEVVTATDGKRAQLALYNDKREIFACVLNIEVENHSGLQVLKYIKVHHPSMKIILTAEHEASLESISLNRNVLEKMGIIDVFFMPLQMDQLRQAIEGVQDVGSILANGPQRVGQSREEKVELEDKKFASVDIDEFVSSKSMQFDVFIRLESGRFIKILHAGDSFSQERIDKYKNEKKVKKLYFLVEDRKKYLRIQNFIAEKAIKSKDIEESTKLQLTKNFGKMLVEEIYTEGIRPQSLEQGKDLCKRVFDIVQTNENLWKLMRQFNDFDPSAFTHGYLVTLFSSMLLKQYEWDSTIVNEVVGLAGLLHDIGKTKLDPSFMTKRPAEMTPEELEEYKKHPMLGAEILSQNSMIPNVVKQIVMQHHECNNGSGFPFGLKRSKILTLSKIVYLVDHFIHIMLDNKCSPPEGLRIMLNEPDCVQRTTIQLINNFIKIFTNPELLQDQKKKKAA